MSREFKVVKDGEQYRIKDEVGNSYGSYDSLPLAEADIPLWKEYYDTPYGKDE
jgi:hypothetical protein